MNRTLYTILYCSAITALLSFNACSGKQTNAHSETSAEHGLHQEEGESDHVSLTAQQAKAIGLKTGHLEKRNLKTSIKAAGQLELPPSDRATVTPYIGGVVKSVKVMEGDAVKKGQVLAYLAQPEFIHLQHQYLETYNKLLFLKKEYERKKKLYKEKITSGKEFQNITSEFESTRASIITQETKLKLLGINVRQVQKGKVVEQVPVTAPISGHIVSVNINTGTFAQTQQGMFDIVNNKNLYVDLDIFENDILKIKKGQKVIFTTANNSSEEFEGRIASVGKAFQPNTKTAKAIVHITKGNKEPLIAGLYVNAAIQTKGQRVWTLPESAVTIEGADAYIFVRTEKKDDDHQHESEPKHEHDEGDTHHGEVHGHPVENGYTFVKTPVILGIKAGKFIEIKALKPMPHHAEIALNGAYYLSAELGKASTHHSH
ncbi:MAG: efflux RND transporter periplasmic adaptor subunit [Cytophagales bacterium]|nr:efflux RND transporter periplasmic adaptor subunit [Cytophagales bacterium]